MIHALVEKVSYSEHAKNLILFPSEFESLAQYNVSNHNTSMINTETSCALLKDAIVSLHINVYIVEYRPGNDWLRVVLHDVPHIAASLGLKAQYTTVYGKGILGSLCAQQYATQFKPHATILDSSVTDVYSFLRRQVQTSGDTTTCLQSSSSQVSTEWERVRATLKHFIGFEQKMQQYKGKLLMLHAEFDSLIPLHFAETVYAANTSSHKGLIIFDTDSCVNIHTKCFKQLIAELRQFLIQNCGGVDGMPLSPKPKEPGQV